jgi:photosystem II stability/assembly factor-like uncharacterized protein
MWSPNLIFRTTNGGYNWTTVYSTGRPAFELCLIDSMAVYVNSTTSSEYGMMLRSYNRGATWDSLPVANSWTCNGISFVNRDTGWVGGSAGGLPYLWRTTNRGVNWTVQSDNTGRGRVFFLKNKVNGEYVGWSQDDGVIWKTTNSGIIWFELSNILSQAGFYFLDENTGFAASYSTMKKTTNGGLNWTVYNMPTSYNIFDNLIGAFKVLNKDTIYGVSGNRYWGPPLRVRGIIWISTNGGVNWNFQQPDTAFQRSKYNGIDFANKDTGFCDFIRTNDGGGPVIITGINSEITEKPGIFKLEQNYPNPFNSSTRIDFSVSIPSYVSLAVYDITGKEVLRIYNNEYFLAGNYFAGIDVGKMKLSSGIYVYRMTVTDSRQNNVFIKSRKLVYMK